MIEPRGGDIGEPRRQIEAPEPVPEREPEPVKVEPQQPVREPEPARTQYLDGERMHRTLLADGWRLIGHRQVAGSVFPVYARPVSGGVTR